MGTTQEEVPCAPDGVVGNRLMLIGAIVYLLEWVAIIPYAGRVLETSGMTAKQVAAQYAQDADGAAIMAGWFSVVLLGRIALAAGLRDAFRQSPQELHLMDFAMGAMVVSVVLEIAAFAFGAAAGWVADTGGDVGVVVALDAGGSLLYQLVFGPLGVFILVSGYAMLRSRLFPAWMCWLGLVAGTLGTAGGVVSAAAFDAGTLLTAFDLLTTVAALGFWIWMLATGIFLFRRAGRRPTHDAVAG